MKLLLYEFYFALGILTIKFSNCKQISCIFWSHINYNTNYVTKLNVSLLGRLGLYKLIKSWLNFFIFFYIFNSYL